MSHLYSMLLWVLLNSYGSKGYKKAHISLQRFTRNDGLHRDFVTRVKFHGVLSDTLCTKSNSCTLMIKETIPSGMYLDLHQLKDPAFLRNQDIQIYSPHKFDTEAPEHLSKKHTVYLYIRLRSRDVLERCAVSVTLPVHLRYHEPSSSVANITVPNPELAFRCKGAEEADSTKKLSAPCSSKRYDQSCDWTLLPGVEGADITLQVPVADPKLAPVVTFVTLVVTTLGAIYLIVVTLRYRNVKTEKTE